MKTRIGCLPCFVKQGLSAVRLSTHDPAEQQRILDEILLRIRGLDLDSPPALLSNIVYGVVAEMTGVADPFAQAKRDTNRRALELLPELRRRIAASPDPLRTAIQVALIGNVVDFGMGDDFDLERDLAQDLDAEKLAIDDYPAFRAALEKTPQRGPRTPSRALPPPASAARTNPAACPANLLSAKRPPDSAAKPRLLYICDNSGEIALDRLLIEQLRDLADVTASVKSAPIINDATMQDAEEVGLTQVVRVIETGSNYIGVNWQRSSKQFIETFRAADLIIAKGQGNFETLDQTPANLFFLLKAKCPEVAAELSVPEGALIFLRTRARRRGRKNPIKAKGKP